jgi:glycosyltransferase involved in cell wall biosynthesis
MYALNYGGYLKILMLSWEFPPHISGGLGTACEGLAQGLSRKNINISFLLPHLYGGENAPYMKIESAFSESQKSINIETDVSDKSSKDTPSHLSPSSLQATKELIQFGAYAKDTSQKNYTDSLNLLCVDAFDKECPLDSHQYRKQLVLSANQYLAQKGTDTTHGHYGSNIFEVVEKFAAAAISLFNDFKGDIIHAHDWMTFPAAIALKNLTGKPLVVHIHSLEYDRSGQQVNNQIHAIEKHGLEKADKIIAVSHYTRSIIQAQHGIPNEKITVIHNGIYPRKVTNQYKTGLGCPGKIVLFLGRMTFQKGPDYLVEAASKVIEHIPDAAFVMAGTGDMLPQLIARVQELGMEKNFRFPGFLSGTQFEEMFAAADLYVMPSVSEPFGLSALEAISFDTPVIISKQSGVSEVLKNVLKVDFWDIDRLADLIINTLKHTELREDMITMAREEIKRVHWDVAASHTVNLYSEFIRN